MQNFYVVVKTLLGSGDYDAGKYKFESLENAKKYVSERKNHFLSVFPKAKIELDTDTFVKLELDVNPEQNCSDTYTKIWIAKNRKGTPI